MIGGIRRRGFSRASVVCVPVALRNQLARRHFKVHQSQRPHAFFGRATCRAPRSARRALGMAFFNLNRMKALKERKPSKWDALIDSGAISQDDLAKAQQDAVAAKMDVGRYLIDKVGVKRSAVEQSLGFSTTARCFISPVPSASRTIAQEDPRRLLETSLRRADRAPRQHARGRHR